MKGRPAQLALLALLAVACRSEQSKETHVAATDASATPSDAPPPEPACPDGGESYRAQTPGGPAVTACKLDGKLHGPYTVELPGGVHTADGKFDHGLETGHWIFRHANGKRWREGEYVAGKEHGTWRVYNVEEHPVGEYTLENGTGTELRYYDNGKPRQSAEMKDGKRHGVAVFWSESGAKIMEAHFENGLPHGSWTFWDEKGAFRKVEDWQAGDIRNTIWAPNGWTEPTPPTETAVGKSPPAKPPAEE